MPATVSLVSWHGPAASKAATALSDGQAFRFKAADNDAADGTGAILVPDVGSSYSYVKNLQLQATSTPANSITNIKFYTDGANGLGTGLDILAKTSATYVDPTTQAQTAVAGTASVFGYTSGAPLTVAGSLNNPNTGVFGDYIVLQAKVDATAGPGTSGSETLTVVFDES